MPKKEGKFSHGVFKALTNAARKTPKTDKPINPSQTTLVDLLTERNQDGKYDTFIERAKAGYYHDFKFHLLPGADYVEPKMQLMHELAAYPELSDIRHAVMHGQFDDKMDEEDKDRMRQDLEADGLGGLKAALGL